MFQVYFYLRNYYGYLIHANHVHGDIRLTHDRKSRTGDNRKVVPGPHYRYMRRQRIEPSEEIRSVTSRSARSSSSSISYHSPSGVWT